MVLIQLLTALGAGALALLSPCAAPILPGIVGALSGDRNGAVSIRRQLALMTIFAIGAAVVLIGSVAGAPRFAEGDDIPPQFASEAKQMNEVLTELAATPDSLDWVFFSPAQQYGSYVPGEALGRYRLGGDVAFFDAEGVSAISGADFALAIVDEIDKPAHHRAQVSVAY